MGFDELIDNMIKELTILLKIVMSRDLFANQSLSLAHVMKNQTKDKYR